MERFYTLDAMRGIAALAVVVMHIGEVMKLHTFHYAYLAVDFFFVLSGFVLTKVYEQKLKTSISARQFIEARILRLYPVFAIGIGFGAITLIGKLMAHSNTSLGQTASIEALISNLLMLPALSSPTILFPIDPPAWSLFLEIVISAIFGLLLFRASSATISAICITAAIAFVLAVHHIGNGEFGSDWRTVALGIIRVGLSFPLGMLIARSTRTSTRSKSVTAYGLLAVQLVVLAITLPSTLDWIYDVAAVLVVMPALVWFGTHYELPIRQLGSVLGDASYPLYVIHYPILQAMAFALTKRSHMPASVVAAIFVPIIFLVAICISRYVDGPLRTRLSAFYHLRRSALPSTG